MPESLRRITAIVRTDILFRFRRMAAVVTVLIAAAGSIFYCPGYS